MIVAGVAHGLISDFSLNHLARSRFGKLTIALGNYSVIG
jgi:hypothetical protein